MSIASLQRPNSRHLYANDMHINKLIPTDDNELVSKKYVDDQISELKDKYNDLVEKYIILFDEYINSKNTIDKLNNRVNVINTFLPF